jgi:predicted TIM-barrel fold metal-dependent hydrolase
MNTNLNRRQFVKLSTGALAGSAAGLSGFHYGCSEKKTKATAGNRRPKSYNFNSFRTAYPEIPRIEGHSHIGPWYPGKEPEPGEYGRFINCFVMRDLLQAFTDVDIALWIDLNNTPVDMLNKLGRGRIASSISDYRPAAGLSYTPEDIPVKLKEGYVGYKFHFGEPNKYNPLYPYIDDPYFEPVLAAMEKAGMVLTNPHLENQWYQVDGKWKVEDTFREQEAIANVMERHPNLRVVQAHFARFRMYPDSWNLQRLAKMFEKFPNYHLDTSTSFMYMHKIDRDELREFYIRHADRLVFGTDIGASSNFDLNRLSRSVQEYAGTFAMLETNERVPESFFLSGSTRWPTKGLELPSEVLEAVYYKNALRIYPGLEEMMNQLGYSQAGKPVSPGDITPAAITVMPVKSRELSFPVIDVNSHITRNDDQAIPVCFAISNLVKANYGRTIAMWVDLDGEIDRFEALGQGRIATAISDYKPAKGLCFDASEIPYLFNKGYVGYNLHFGAQNKFNLIHPFIDEPHYGKVLAEMEKAGMVLSSVWLNDGFHIEGLEYARNTNEQFIALENIMQRHPDLKVVVTECGGFGRELNRNSIAELTRLCSSYKNYHVDLAGVFSFLHKSDHQALREFLIQFQDRVLFGTDTGSDGMVANASLSLDGIQKTVENYITLFEILETDKEFTPGTPGEKKVHGLNLPSETLEYIYYRNACRIYPVVAEMMKKNGYQV